MALLLWLIAVMLLGLTARLASASTNGEVTRPAKTPSTAPVLDDPDDCDCDGDEDDGDDEREDDRARRSADELIDAGDDDDDDDPIDIEDLMLDEEPTAAAPSVIAEEKRDAMRARGGAKRIDVSLGWRRHVAVGGDGGNEVWLTAAWRL